MVGCIQVLLVSCSRGGTTTGRSRRAQGLSWCSRSQFPACDVGAGGRAQRHVWHSAGARGGDGSQCCLVIDRCGVRERGETAHLEPWRVTVPFTESGLGGQG